MYEHGEKYFNLINGSYGYTNIAQCYVTLPIPFLLIRLKKFLIFFINFKRRQSPWQQQNYNYIKNKGL